MKCPLCEMEVTEKDWENDPDPKKFDKIKSKIGRYKKGNLDDLLK